MEKSPEELERLIAESCAEELQKPRQPNVLRLRPGGRFSVTVGGRADSRKRQP